MLKFWIAVGIVAATFAMSGLGAAIDSKKSDSGPVWKVEGAMGRAKKGLSDGSRNAPYSYRAVSWLRSSIKTKPFHFVQQRLVIDLQDSSRLFAIPPS
jgi:hypothetical protein